MTRPIISAQYFTSNGLSADFNFLTVIQILVKQASFLPFLPFNEFLLFLSIFIFIHKIIIYFKYIYSPLLSSLFVISISCVSVIKFYFNQCTCLMHCRFLIIGTYFSPCKANRLLPFVITHLFNDHTIQCTLNVVISLEFLYLIV